MQYYYSPSTRGFYTPEIHGTIPADAVSITAELYASLLAGQSSGKIIMPPDAGHALPYLAEAPPLTPEQVAAMRREEILGQLDALDAAQINLRTLANVALGDADATAILVAKMAAHEAVAAPLRAELITLPAN
jgi:hypothetical protein